MQKGHNVYPKDRFIKVGIGRDYHNMLALYDYFLDTHSGDSDDAPLVRMELFEEDYDDGEEPDEFLESDVRDLHKKTGTEKTGTGELYAR